MPPPEVPASSAVKIDRTKVRAALRKVGAEYVFYMLDEAIDLLTDEQLARLVGKYIRRDGFEPDADAVKPDLFAVIKEFERASLAGEYYEDFNVNSHNFTSVSGGTQAWIAECNRLFDQLVAVAGEAEPRRVVAAFETLFGLLRKIDECSVDIIFFGDEAGSWQVGVDWRAVLPAWFGRLSAISTPEEYAKVVTTAIEDFDHPDWAKHIAAARKAATPAQERAVDVALRAPRRRR